MPEFRSLVEGYRRFREDQYLAHRRRWERLASGQEPPVMVISCCDSRVDPAMIFDTEPGQAFILRNVANLVPPFELGGGLHGASAAIEFAVLHLQVRHIVVLGHGSCGGCAAALTGQFDDEDKTDGHFIAKWIELLRPARERIRRDFDGVLSPAAFQTMEKEAVKVSLANLRTFPWITEREADGRLKLHGAFFAISDGILHVLDEGSGTFSPA